MCLRWSRREKSVCLGGLLSCRRRMKIPAVCRILPKQCWFTKRKLLMEDGRMSRKKLTTPTCSHFKNKSIISVTPHPSRVLRSTTTLMLVSLHLITADCQWASVTIRSLIEQVRWFNPKWLRLNNCTYLQSLSNSLIVRGSVITRRADVFIPLKLIQNVFQQVICLNWANKAKRFKQSEIWRSLREACSQRWSVNRLDAVCFKNFNNKVQLRKCNKFLE